MSADLDFALALADLADSLALPRFRASDLQVETKPDLTPVTDADRAVERALRERIAAERPGEGVLGEEEGDSGGPVRWILDPIDGTKNFSRGIPVWATQVALEREGVVELGVVSAPALGRRWWAERGGGAFANGQRIRVSRIGRLADASVSGRAFAGRAWHVRGFGDFWQHMLVAEGALEAALDQEVAPWDILPDAIIVEEAGGLCTSVDGGPAVGSLVSTNGLVHDEVLAAIAAAPPRL